MSSTSSIQGAVELPPHLQSPAQGYRGYCETLEQLSAFLRISSAEAGEDAPDCARSICIREQAHREGELFSPLNGQQPIYALLGYHDLQTLEGRLLTIIDASFSDQQQRKAVKDLVRNALWWDWVKYLDTDDQHIGKPDLCS